MSNIQLKRGLSTNFAPITLVSGEPCFTTDTHELYIGDGTGKFKINGSGPQGIQGIQGIQGVNGLSAYQIWLNQGNTGTELEYIASLKGVKGDTGATGASGVSLASPAFTGTPTAPTPTTADNTTKLATTAFVKAQGYLTNTSNIDGGTF